MDNGRRRAYDDVPGAAPEAFPFIHTHQGSHSFPRRMLSPAAWEGQ